jgi:hypothetical protein
VAERREAREREREDAMASIASRGGDEPDTARVVLEARVVQREAGIGVHVVGRRRWGPKGSGFRGRGHGRRLLRHA